MLGDPGWDAAAAVRALARAQDAVDDAVRLLQDADAVQWTGPGATGYRDRLEEVTRAVRRSRARLRECTRAVGEHVTARRTEPGGLTGTDAPWAAPQWLLPWEPADPWHGRGSAPRAGAGP